MPPPPQVQGVQEEVQLREQDFGAAGWLQRLLRRLPWQLAPGCPLPSLSRLRPRPPVPPALPAHSSQHPLAPPSAAGNFQDAEGKKREKAERLRFGRFFYR